MTSNEILSMLSVVYDLDLPSTHFEAHKEEIVQDYTKLKQYKGLGDRDKWFLSWINTYGYKTFNLIDILLTSRKLGNDNKYISSWLARSIDYVHSLGSLIGMKADLIRSLSIELVDQLNVTEGLNGVVLGIEPDYSINFKIQYRIDNSSITNSYTQESKDMLVDYVINRADIVISKILSQYKWRIENNDLFNGYRIRMRDIYDYMIEQVLGDTKHIILSTEAYMYNTDGRIICIEDEVLEKCAQASESDRVAIFLNYIHEKLNGR